MNYLKSIMYAFICALILFVLLSFRQRNRWEAKRFEWEKDRFIFDELRFEAWYHDRKLMEKYREEQKLAAEARRAAEEEKKRTLHAKRQSKGEK
jgi:hypothetical protein